MIMLEEMDPSESWVRVYTDGSATMLQRKEGLVYTFSIPMKSINQRQYIQAYTVPATKLKGKASLLQALINDNLPQLEQALYTIKTLRTVLQWIPSHSGVHGNEQVD